MQRQADELASQDDWGPETEQINRRLVELDPARTVAYTRLAKCLRERGDPEPAETLYRRVLELEPDNRSAANNLKRLESEREMATRGDVDQAAETRARTRRGVVQPVSDPEFDLLTEACRAVPRTSADYQHPDYLTNVLLTVLDLRMHNVVVNNAITYFRQHQRDEIRSIEDLQAALDRFPTDQEGNRQAAQYLWGNNHWLRIECLRESWCRSSSATV